MPLVVDPLLLLRLWPDAEPEPLDPERKVAVPAFNQLGPPPGPRTGRGCARGTELPELPDEDLERELGPGRPPRL